MAQRNSIKKIAIVGAESTGKTWLCESLAKHYNTAFVPEYAREYFDNADINNYGLEDLIAIAKKQMDLENDMIKCANKFLFCDTTLITLKIWAELEFNNVPAFIKEQLSKQDYDFYLITNNAVAWTADPQRQNKHPRDLLFNMNETEVQKSNIPYAVVSGKEEGLREAVEMITKLFQ